MTGEWFLSIKSILAISVITNLFTPVLFLRPQERIVGGRHAQWNEAPWAMSIRYRRRDKQFGYGHFCGGTLIDPRTVVTATHCFVNMTTGRIMFRAEDIVVVGGNLDRLDIQKASYVGLVQNFFLHRQFNLKGANDIAVIILRRPVPENTKNMRTLPMIGERSDLPTNTTCGISGWGAIHYKGPRSRYLKVANISVFHPNLCARVYGSYPQNVICAGKYGGGEDSCQGDSGGALMCNNVLAGVVSFGLECANKWFPGIYTDVRQYHYWIRTAEFNSGCKLRPQISILLLLLIFLLIN